MDDTNERAAHALGLIFKALCKAGGPFIGPKGGKWADPAHTIPWHANAAGYRQAFVQAPTPNAAVHAQIAWRTAHYADWLKHHPMAALRGENQHNAWLALMKEGHEATLNPEHEHHQEWSESMRDNQRRLSPEGAKDKRQRAKAEREHAAYEAQGHAPEDGASLKSLRGKQVWLYHGASDKHQDDILQHGIRPSRETGVKSNVGKSAFVGADPNHAYLTSDPNDARKYAEQAARRHGGSPVVFRVLHNGDELSRDPDDTDISSGRKQFAVDRVRPEQIMEINGKRRTDQSRVGAGKK